MGLFNRLSIQSKLLLMLLGVSIGSILAVAWIGYVNGREAVVNALRNQLAGLCQVKAALVRSQLNTIRGEVIALSADETFTNAMKSFKAAYHDLNTKPVPREWDDKLTEFYSRTFLPELRKRMETEPVLENYVPRIPASRYLQHQYIAHNVHPYMKKDAMLSSGDGTTFDEIHRRFHPYFRLVAASYGFEDVMLVDSDSGEIVYTVQKTTEFATNLFSGPYANSNVGELFREIHKGMDRDDFRMVDFERYRPNLNLPSSFIASPIFDENKMIGVLILQFPIDHFSKIMTGDENWEKEGLGKTGEVYLVGPDLLMRSRSRELWESRESEARPLLEKKGHPEEIEKARQAGFEGFLARLRASGVTEQAITRMRQAGTAVLTLKVGSEAARRGIEGKTDTIFQTDYRGEPVIASFVPLEPVGLMGGERNRWAVVAKMDIKEAFEPIYRFRRMVLSSAVAIMLMVTLLALLLSRVFTRPLNKLAAGARLVSEGNIDVTVDVESHDEFRELADVFNRMTRNLRSKTDLIDQKIRENEELLLNILPSSAVARHKGGEKQFSETFADVTVLFADIQGLSELTGDRAADYTLAILNELVVAFDEAAERFGVEKVKTVGESYMAVCGLSVQRPDHTNRVVEFAKDLLKIIRRFNKDRGVRLGLSIAINSGPVVGGVVGTNKFIYDLWGDTVNLARQIKATAQAGDTIRVTRDVRDRLGDLHEFEPRGEVELGAKGSQPVWSVKV